MYNENNNELNGNYNIMKNNIINLRITFTILNYFEILPHALQSVPSFSCALESPHQLPHEHHLWQGMLVPDGVPWHV